MSERKKIKMYGRPEKPRRISEHVGYKQVMRHAIKRCF